MQIVVKLLALFFNILNKFCDPKHRIICFQIILEKCGLLFMKQFLPVLVEFSPLDVASTPAELVELLGLRVVSCVFDIKLMLHRSQGNGQDPGTITQDVDGNG